MNACSPHLRRLLLAAAAALLSAVAAPAQNEITGGGFNRLFQPSAPPAQIGTQPQFAGEMANTGGSAYDRTAARFPASASSGITLRRSSFGTTFAVGVPRYMLGDVITPPTTAFDGTTTAAADYWRTEPVKPGEIFSHPAGSPATETPIAANTAIAYYYSRHADRVFASQAGRVTVRWVTRVPLAIPGDSNLRYRFREETFSVSSATTRPIRNIFWTERGFNSPVVTIPAGKIELVNPVYSANFPATVATEYRPVGYNPPDPNAAPPQEKRTVWFEKTAGIGQLRAYNHEGRLFIEYLGALKPGTTDTHEFLGADIVEVARIAPSINASVELGELITARDELNRALPLDGSSEWLASPVIESSPDALSFYGSVNRRDGRTIYYAERENDNPDRVVFYWLEAADASIHFLTNARPNLGLYWPQHRNNYVQQWPTDLSRYAHYTVAAAGSTTETGLQFPPGQTPQIVYQDHPSQDQAAIDTGTQRLVINFSNDGLNRSLLKFTSGSDVWYVRLFSQAETRSASIAILEGGAGYTSAPTVSFPGLTGAAATATVSGGRVTGITLTSVPSNFSSSASVVLTGGGGAGAVAQIRDVGFQEADGLAAIATTVNVGDRIVAPAGYLLGGYIAGGTNYLPAAYINPFANGALAAERGAIIPVNAMPGASTLTVWWFRKIDAPSTAFQPFYTPAKIARYTAAYPTNPATIVLASNAGSGDLAPDQLAGSLYVQNDRNLPGFNPNEEHALLLAGRVYALRDDLNDTTANLSPYTSEPFALLHYTSAADNRPAMRVFKVLRELDLAGTANDVLFDYPLTAGTIIQAPMPLPLLPLPVRPDGTLANTEVTGVADPSPVATAPGHYNSFTYRDRKGYHWVYRGPHASGSPSFGMKFYYTMREGFFVPGVATQPAVGTVLPYLRPLSGGVPVGDPVSATALTVTYRPVWPANAPELRVAETLTLPKLGLPAVMPQSSAVVLYQQSIATTSIDAVSVRLHDPFREKTYALGAPSGLQSIPTSILTSRYQGRTYFQRLPAHLQKRFYFDPQRGTHGTLVLLGSLVDEPAGEDYVHLNVLSLADYDAIRGLVSVSDTNAGRWNDAIAALSSTLETFVPDPAKAGAFRSNGTPRRIGPQELATITDSDSAVTDYAVTATGAGSGWVTMLFGDGRAFTPTGEPVVMQVFKVAPRLYTGELKVLLPDNPLDEQVSLRHTADFAARPQDYEFEWRYAPPQGGTPPAIYSHTMTLWSSGNWRLVQNPGATLPTAAQYAATTAVPLPRSVTINSTTPDAILPGLVAKAENALTLTGAVPQRIVFSASIADRTGFVLYVNGSAALAYQAPSGFTATGASSGLVTGGLPLQFNVDPGFFTLGANRIEVALFSSSDPGASSGIDFALHTATSTDMVLAAGSPWQAPNGTLTNLVTVGGSPTAPLGSPLLVMTDNYFTMRYRAKTGTTNVTGTTWSAWMQPKLVEGWIKRVLAAINPFNQRMTDLYNNAVNTDVSLLTQAGKRWEGDIALSLENINDFGLIEIYETLLNRGRAMSIESGYDYAPANDALLLAAGYLNDLYTIAGNEAFADAANPTISLDDSATVTEVNTSRFSFEGQVRSVLEEELALLRGRDDFLQPGVTVAPSYNRLVWNYTRGINSGEALYAVNYNIREKSGSSTANGIVDAADAQRMFPQGHGDAYGHYLTALKGYYRLLQSPHFTWTPRSEAVTVLGQAVQVDYFDERKFAASASALGRTAQQILALTHRQSYRDDPAAGWTHFRDGKPNPATLTTRHWGLDEWASRSAQGAFINWAVGNALLPDKDNNPQHTGIQIVDRTTVPDLAELTVIAEDFQTRIDNANARLNPLGLSPGAIAFDISPADLKAGKSHYDQIHERALRAVLNAKGAFDQAARMTRLLRNQENQIGNSNDAIVDQERAFEKQLIEIYGTPYSGEIGAGRTYAQGYTGPDYINWFVVDRPSDLVDTSQPLTLTVRVPTQVQTFTTLSADQILERYQTASNTSTLQVRTVNLQPNQVVQFSDTWSLASPGTRRVTGSLQQALIDLHQTQIAMREAFARYQNQEQTFLRRNALYREMVSTRLAVVADRDRTDDKNSELKLAQAGLLAAAEIAKALAQRFKDTAGSVAEYPPSVVGFANDATSSVRASIKVVGSTAATFATGIAAVSSNAAKYLQAQAENNLVLSGRRIEELGFTYETRQVAYEYEILLRDLIDAHFEIAQLATNVQRAAQRVNNLIAEGTRLQSERELYRQRAAALIQGYRTKDLTFRTFRNEALEQYRSLFDLAGRYTYLAAKSYDYETGLLGSTAGQSAIDAIVAARSLGDLSGGQPQATVSTLGDAGLAGTMARLQADWSVAKGRLGINNPDTNGTLFSLRRELFRILDDPAATDDDAQWQQTLEQHIVSNLLADPDVAALCRNLRNAGGGNVPGIIIPFGTTIEAGKNFFGLPYVAGDRNFTPSNFATKIYSAGLVFRGYVGMDPYSPGVVFAGTPNSTAPNALGATPYVYLIPVGTDYMLAPPLGDTGIVRAFTVRDQALPLPFNLGATQFSATQFYNANGTLSEQPWILRKHQAFRPVGDPNLFYSSMPAEFTNSRLVGRSVWNGGWKLVIPAYTLMGNEQEGLNRFVASVKDIELFLRTYSHSGN